MENHLFLFWALLLLSQSVSAFNYESDNSAVSSQASNCLESGCSVQQGLRCLQDKQFDLYAKGVPLTIQQNQLVFTDCSSNYFTFKYSESGNFKAKYVSSAKEECNHNYDYAYIQAIDSSTRIIHKNTYIRLEDDEENIKLILKPEKRLQQSKQDRAIVGQYLAYLPPLRLTTTQNSFSLEGCNRFSFEYSLLTPHKISTKLTSETQIACTEAYDQIFVDALQESSYIQASGNQLWCSFYLKGNEHEKSRSAFAIPHNNAKQDQKSLLPGEYKLYLTRSELPAINVRITEESISFNGCNRNSFSYQALPNRRIVFIKSISTKKGCRDSNDQEYVSAFRSVDQFQYQNGELILLDQKNQIVFSQTEGYAAESIDYRIIWLNSQPYDDQIIVTLRGQEIFVKGCNYHRAELKYLKNHEVKIGAFKAETLLACENKSDSKIIRNALLRSKKVIKQDNRVSFYGEGGVKLIELKSGW